MDKQSSKEERSGPAADETRATDAAGDRPQIVELKVDRNSIESIEATIETLYRMYEQLRDVKLFMGKLEISKEVWMTRPSAEIGLVVGYQMVKLSDEMKQKVATEHCRAHF